MCLHGFDFYKVFQESRPVWRFGVKSTHNHRASSCKGFWGSVSSSPCIIVCTEKLRLREVRWLARVAQRLLLSLGSGWRVCAVPFDTHCYWKIVPTSWLPARVSGGRSRQEEFPGHLILVELIINSHWFHLCQRYTCIWVVLKRTRRKRQQLT